MLEKFFEEWKKEYEEVTQALIKKLAQKYEDLWKELMEDLQKRKLKVEGDLKEKEAELNKRNKESSALADEIIKLEEGVRKENRRLAEIDGKAEKMAVKYLEHEKKIERIVEREKAVGEKEKDQKEMDLTLKAREISIQEKMRTVKRAYDKLGQ